MTAWHGVRTLTPDRIGHQSWATALPRARKTIPRPARITFTREINFSLEKQ